MWVFHVAIIALITVVLCCFSYFKLSSTVSDEIKIYKSLLLLWTVVSPG